ncbi:hypothetical protein NIES22_58550 [Calothrix brevissima NIES-22]|nr:hypothetical protein NIES22_58550 [Calothrix brevissima NIES-22]
MLGWVFSGFVKKLERSGKKVSRDFGKSISKELNPLANKMDYIAKERIKEIKRLEHKFTDDIEKLEDKFTDDIGTLINHADHKVKENLKEIDEIRKLALSDVRKTIGEVDAYLENRINQISLAVMRALSQTEASVQKIITEINILEDIFFEDANQLVDKIDIMIERNREAISNEFKKYTAHAIPNPFDKCRQRLNIGMKSGAMLCDVELYELGECYELSKLSENSSIDDVLKTYGQLQLNAARMAVLVNRSPELKRRAIEDWLKYGLLCEFWRKTMSDYSHTENYLLKPKQSHKFLTGK